MILIILIILLALQALTDSLFSNGFKAASKLIECLVILIFIWQPIAFNWVKIKFYSIKKIAAYLVDLTILYICLRISFFDLFYNMFSGLDLNFVGSTTYIWDTLLSHFSDWHFWVLRGFFFICALLIWDRKIK